MEVKPVEMLTRPHGSSAHAVTDLGRGRYLLQPDSGEEAGDELAAFQSVAEYAEDWDGHGYRIERINRNAEMGVDLVDEIIIEVDAKSDA